MAASNSGTLDFSTMSVLPYPIIICDVMTDGYDAEWEYDTFVGRMRVFDVPKKGEMLWFPHSENLKPDIGETAWLVTDVAHWVMDHTKAPHVECYQHCALYVRRLSPDRKRMIRKTVKG